MSISSETRKAGPYTGNGVTVAFPFAFKVFSAADVQVIRTITETETVLTLSTHYTIALNADQDANPGGTVTMLAAPAVGYLITIASIVANFQPVVLTNAGGFYPRVINDALDRTTIIVQQLAEKVSRAVKVNISSSITPDQLVAEIVSAVSDSSASAASAAASADDAADAASAITLPIPVGSGGTGATTAAAARAALNSAQGRDGGAYGALQVNGADTLRFGSDTSGQLAGFRNRIINGGFKIHQRVGAALVSGAYPADRTYVNYSGADCSAIMTYGYSFGGYAAAQNAIVITGAAGNTGVGCVQIIEAANCNDLAGKAVTVSFWIYQDSGATASIICNIYYPNTLNGGAASITPAMASPPVVSAPSGQWTYCTYTGTLSVAAITGLLVSISGVPVTAGKTMRLANLQLEAGSIATPFEQRPIDVELAMCKRYLPAFNAYASASQAYLCGGFALSDTLFRAMYQFEVPPRVPPTGLLTSTPSNFSVSTAPVANPVSAIAFVSSSTRMANINVTTSGMVAGQGGVFRQTATSGQLLFTGCEL